MEDINVITVWNEVGNNCVGAIAPFNRCSLNLSVFPFVCSPNAVAGRFLQSVIRDSLENVSGILINVEKWHQELSIGKRKKKKVCQLWQFLTWFSRSYICDWKLLCKEISKIIPPARWNTDGQDFHTTECTGERPGGIGVLLHLFFSIIWKSSYRPYVQISW